jgi:hypothetical protein
VRTAVVVDKINFFCFLLTFALTRMSKLNKKLAFLKQQHQQFKLKLQSAKAEAAQRLSDNSNSPQLASMSPPFTSRQSEFAEMSPSAGTSPSVTSRRKGEQNYINSFLDLQECGAALNNSWCRETVVNLTS